MLNASLSKYAICVIGLLNLTISNAHNANEGFSRFRGAYLGQELPGCKPEPFIPELFSVWSDYGFHLNGCVRFSPDNNEIIFSNQTLPSVPGKSCSVWRMLQKNGIWTEPQVVNFSSDCSDHGAFYSSTGDTLYFSSTRSSNEKGRSKDSDTWYVVKDKDDWARPQRLSFPINTAYNEFGGAMTASGTMYLSSDRPGGKGGADIYYAQFIHGSHGPLINLGETVNTNAEEYVVHVADDERFMILHRTGLRDRAGTGLYVSYKEANRGWTRARSMGDHINILNAVDASVSSDGNYLFLLSKGNGVYWLKTDLIKYLQHENLEISGLLIDAAAKEDFAAALLTYHDLKKRHSGFMDFDEYLLNQRGHQLLDAAQYAEAILLFQIAVELFPDSWNAYDSLGEAYLASAQVTSAKRCYEKSLEINPQNENALEMLKYIKTILHH